MRVCVCMCVGGEGGWLSPGLLAVRSRVNQNQTRYFRQTSLTRCPSAQRSRGGPAGRSRVRKLPDPRRGCWVREPRGRARRPPRCLFRTGGNAVGQRHPCPLVQRLRLGSFSDHLLAAIFLGLE